MARRVYLHVGIAKTGTTYLQRTLFTNRELLERHGVRYPGVKPGSQFLGSLDLRGTTFKGHTYDGLEGSWGRLVAQVDAFAGNALISHETLAHAKPEHIDRAVHSFTTDDVRVVVTCRDLARQVPAVWQESVKNRGERGYDEFLAQVFSSWRRKGRLTGGFWRAQDTAALVSRWADVVGIARVCLVTVPPSGAEKLELWRRFARATELPDLDYSFARSAGNTSLGVTEAELLRRLNPLLKDELDWPQYERVVKRQLVEGVLAPIDQQHRITVPPAWQPDLAAITLEQLELLERSGVTVVGDLRDLEVPAVESARPAPQPSDVTDRELLDVSLQVVARLTAQRNRAPMLPPQPSLRQLLEPGSFRQVTELLRSTVRRRFRSRSSPK